jgi:hypothetical protein
MTKRKQRHGKVRAKPCAEEQCKTLVQPRSTRCWKHQGIRLAAIMRERYQNDPGYAALCRARLLTTWHNKWTIQEDNLIRALAGIETRVEIAHRCEAESGLRRSDHAIENRARKLGVYTGRELWWTESDLMKVFGVGRPSVQAWVAAGQIESTPWGSSLRVFSVAQIESFMRAYPWLYDLDCMARGRFHQLAEVIQRRDPWWDTRRVIEETGIPRHMLKRLRADGLLDSRRRPGPNGGYLMYRAIDVTGLDDVLAARRDRVRAWRMRNLKRHRRPQPKAAQAL